MNFFQRFGYFAFGTALGCLLVYALLIRDRDFPAWLPADRVIEELAVDSVVIAQGIELPFADSLLVSRIKESDVLFNESKVRDTPCKEYQLESDLERMRFKICNSQILLYQYEPK
ncbi:MAG: hypothetical protein K9J17_05660 [Flavobacteriales bacterium]|nr:hypothetical protein [Flavobacteriales bacterium]